VAGQLGQVGPGAGAVHALDRLADPLVQLHPGRDRQPLVEHLTDEGVREAVPAGPWLLGHAEGDRLRQPAEDALGGEVGGGPDQRQVELPAHHRRGRQHLDGVGRQRRQPPPDHRPDGPRDRHRPARPLQGGLGGQQAHGLTDEQRVALGPLVDGGDPCLGRHHPRQQLDEGPYRSTVQPPKVEQLPLAHQLPQRLPDAPRSPGNHLAGGRHHQQPGAAKVPGQELQQQHGGLIGGVQVVQDQQHRLRRRRPPEQAGDGLEQGETRRIGPRRGNRGGRGRPHALGEAGDQLGDLGRPRTQPGGEGLLVEVLGEGADHLAPRPEGRCAPTLPAATPQDTGPLLDGVRCHVLGEPGLADPGLPDDQEQPTPTADRVLQAGQQLRHFPIPAHEGP
jgi:hypothetical protein